MKKSELSPLAQLVLKNYEVDTKGSTRFLTDHLMKAMVSKAVVDVMMVRFEVEEERSGHTNPNVYVEAKWEVEKYLGL